MVLMTQSIGEVHKLLKDIHEEAGICLGLACWWLKSQKKDVWSLLGNLLLPAGRVNEDLLKKIAADCKDAEQKEYVESLGRSGLAFRGAAAPLKPIPLKMVDKNDPLQKVYREYGNWVFEAKGTLAILAIEGGNFRTGHAMAVNLEKAVFFDPNFGEFRFKTKDHLKEYLNKMFPLFPDAEKPLGFAYLQRPPVWGGSAAKVIKMLGWAPSKYFDTGRRYDFALAA
jgi:hypothetical protein